MLSSAISFLMLHVLLFMLHLLMKDIVNLKSNFNKLLLKRLSFENELQNILTSNRTYVINHCSSETHKGSNIKPEFDY